MGLAGATQRIADGQMITVDGNRGTVRVRQEAEGVVLTPEPPPV